MCVYVYRDADKVDDVMDSINESIQLADEVSEAMSQNIGNVVDEVIHTHHLCIIMTA